LDKLVKFDVAFKSCGSREVEIYSTFDEDVVFECKNCGEEEKKI